MLLELKLGSGGGGSCTKWYVMQKVKEVYYVLFKSQTTMYCTVSVTTMYTCMSFSSHPEIALR